jgi:outer membrane protein assembly factor BamA
VYVHAGAALAIDRRDSASAPRSGGLLGLLAWRFDALDTAADDFSRVALDGRYFSPVTAASVVALRALTSTDIGDGRARVPFYMQQTLGGGDTLRGFERARFRGPSLVNLSAEYRWDVHPRIELAGFGDVGQVASSLRTLAPRRFESIWGAGVRVKKTGAVKFRLDFAISREGRRLMLSTAPVF